MTKSAWLKLTLIIVSIAMALSLFACGDPVEDDTTTTDAPEQTTEAPEQTTEKPEETTEAPETDTKAPETDTKAPETETKAPETETKEPETETKAPETETKEPETETEPDPYEDFGMIVLPEQLASAGSSGVGEKKVSEDGSYVNLPGTGAGDGWLLAFTGNTEPGKYVVIKYRFNNATYANRPGFSGNVNAQPLGGDETRVNMPVVSDGEWHIAAYNMTAFCKDGQLTVGEDGKVVVGYWRMDVADGMAADASVDIAYVGVIDDIATLVKFAAAQGEKTVEVSTEVEKVDTYYTSTGTTTPSITDITSLLYTPEDLVYITGTRLGERVLAEDGSYVNFYGSGATDARINELIPQDGVGAAGQYIVFKYRYPSTNVNTYTKVQVYADGMNGTMLPVVADGQWHVAVWDLATLGGWAANEDGTYTTSWFRFDLLNDATPTTDCLQIAYIGVVSNVDNIVKMSADCYAVDFSGAENVTIYPATGTSTPAPEVFVGPEQLAAGSNNFNGKVDITIAEDGSYVRFARNTALGDGYLMLLNGNTAVTGQYVVIKYRTDHMPKGEFWANTTENGHAYQGTAGKTNHQMEFVTDGEWHILVVDLSTKTPDYVVANENGEYIIQWSRIDLLNNSAAEGYFDLAFVIYTDNLAEVSSYVTEADQAWCAHAEGEDHICVICGFVFEVEETESETESEPVETESTEETEPIETDPFENVDLEEITSLLLTPEALQTLAGTRLGERVLAEDGSYVSIYGSGAADARFNELIPQDGVGAAGQYLIFKYRYPETNTNTYANVQVYADGMNGTMLPVIADGQWHVAVWDLADLGKWAANEDGTYTTSWFRFDLLNDNTPTTDCIQIAYIGVATNVDVSVETDPFENVDLEEITSLLLTPEALQTLAGTRLGERVLAEDGSYVSIYGSGAADARFNELIPQDGVGAAGQYLIFKYRYPETNTNTYANVQVYADGMNGTMLPVVADGQWHVAVWDLADLGKWAANEDGTYTTSWFRFDLLNDNTPTTDCIQIAYIGVATNVD